MIRFLERLSTHLPKRTIYRRHKGDTAERELYLERFYLWRGKRLGIYLHRFWASDEEGLHDHPWNAVTRILTGWYVERTMDYPPRFVSAENGWRFMPKQMFHRITIPESERGKVWTIFIRFRRQREWGFLPAGTEEHWVRVPYTGEEYPLGEATV
jgi:hypothetical protein